MREGTAEITARPETAALHRRSGLLFSGASRPSESPSRQFQGKLQWKQSVQSAQELSTITRSSRAMPWIRPHLASSFYLDKSRDNNQAGRTRAAMMPR